MCKLRADCLHQVQESFHIAFKKAAQGKKHRDHRDESDSDSNSDFCSVGLDTTGELCVCKTIKNMSELHNTYPCSNKAVHTTNLSANRISNNSKKPILYIEFFLKILQQKNMKLIKVMLPVLRMTSQPLMMMSQPSTVMSVTKTSQIRVSDAKLQAQNRIWE
jgi:hypothetical protein